MSIETSSKVVVSHPPLPEIIGKCVSTIKEWTLLSHTMLWFLVMDLKPSVWIIGLPSFRSIDAQQMNDVVCLLFSTLRKIEKKEFCVNLVG